MLDLVSISAVSVPTSPGKIESNLELIHSWANKSAEAGAQLVFFQELSLTGFIPNHPEGDHDQWLREALSKGRETAVSLKSSVMDELANIAKSAGVILSVGILEDAGNQLFNSQVIVEQTGVTGVFRKMHIPMYEMPFYNGGGVPEVIETELGRIGVNICFDSLIPESTRLLAVQNAEIVLFPFAADPPPCTCEGWGEWAIPALRARCQENGVFGVACNYVGEVEFAGVKQLFPGGGVAIGPRGEVLKNWEHQTGEAGMMLVELKKDDLLSARSEPEYLFRFRRPELYDSLCE